MKTKSITASLLLIVFLVFSPFRPIQSASAACSGIIYVDASSGVGGPNGCSWGTAFSKLQDALAIASNGDEIWVADGTYYPDEGAGQSNNNRNSTFSLVNGVEVYGGFAGNESLLSQRNPSVNVTVLSGDIGTVGADGDNAYHVVSAIGNLSNTHMLDGFTITRGNSNGTSGHGGGIFIQDTSPTLANLVVTNNSASANGAGIYILSLGTVRAAYSSPVITNTVISNNTAARGGGLYTQNGSPVITNVTFSSNSATGGAGGGMNNQVLNEVTDQYSIPLLTNVTFSGNVARGGAGLFNNHSFPTLTNVTFSANVASIRGGAVLNEGANPIFRNVTFTGNSAPVGTGGALRNIVNAAGATSNPQIYNSIIWGNGPDQITSDNTGATTVVDSIVEGGFAGTNVLNTNPNLATLANNGGFTQTHALLAGSSAIDSAGFNSVCASTDQRGVTRPQGNGCDMGAFELSGPTPPTSIPTATSAPTQTPTFTATAIPTNTVIAPTEIVTSTPTATLPSTATLPPTSTFTPIPTSTGTQDIYRVATDGVSNSSCGANWSNPCDLQYALSTLANANDQLWIKQGVYTPGNNRSSSFDLKNGVALYGGFSGTETTLNQRNSDPATNNTVLSGDIGTIGAIADNVYHILTAYSVASVTLDGFTISGGNANAATGNFGGGLYSENSNPTLVNIVFSNNSTNGAGGAMFAVTNNQTLRVNYTVPILTRVVFSGNTAARGGGLFTQNSSPVLTDVIFIGNLANGGAGGGMNNQVLDEIIDEYSIPLLNNVTFSGNTANGGGGLFNNNSNPILTNVTFSGNIANIRGGAMLNEGGDPILRNVTMSGNTAPAGFGGSMRNIINAVGESSNPKIYNSILWGNGTEEITSDGTGQTTLIDSVVQGGCPSSAVCTNVINANPNLNALANNGGYTQTRALDAGSSAIDTGGVNSACPAVDQRGITRPQGSGCDIGSYEADGAFVPTNTPTNTAVPTATFTPTNTATVVPTDTPVPPTATFTATSTPTDTPVPPTTTHTPTNTPIPPTATFTPTNTATFTPTFTPTNTATFTPTATNTPVSTDVLYLSSSTNGTAGGVAFADEDILQHNRATNTWSMYFDGSDVGVTSDVDAFALMSDGTILMSLDADVTVGGLGTVDDSDIIRFTPTSLGSNTAGTFTWYFDGSDVGLTTTAEDVDAFDFAPDGKLVISTLGALSVTGVSGNDEDLIVFTATALGSTTSGTWVLYFDGSDVGLNEATSEQISGVWIDPVSNRLYLTAAGAFTVTGVTGDGADIFICTPGTLGAATTCTYAQYWDGSANGFAGEIVDGLDIVK